MRPLRSLALGLGASALLARPTLAEACSVCGCGDPTLTVMGDEKPFTGRFRVDLDRARSGASAWASPASTRSTSSEERVEIAAAYAPTPSLFLVLGIPALERQAVFTGGATSKAFSLGDVELRAKQFVWNGRRGPFLHQFALQGGVKLPTASVQRDAQGGVLPEAIQPGMGSVTPFAGVFYGMGRGPWSVSASVTVLLPFPVLPAAHASDSFRSSASVQRQVGQKFAARLGLDTRLDGSGELNGQPDPNSGGFIAYLSPGLVLSPVTDLLLSVGAYFPFAQVLQGYHHEDAIAALGVTYDF